MGNTKYLHIWPLSLHYWFLSTVFLANTCSQKLSWNNLKKVSLRKFISILRLQHAAMSYFFFFFFFFLIFSMPSFSCLILLSIALLWAPIKFVTSTLCLFTSYIRGLDSHQPISVVAVVGHTVSLLNKPQSFPIRQNWLMILLSS